jgi:hypothetical protein
MGTKHGYTEKRCSMCGKMKPRSAYPKRGGLACTECQKPQRRKEAADRWKNASEAEKEKNRRKAREGMRKKRGK